MQTVTALFTEGQLALSFTMHILVADRAVVLFTGEPLLGTALRARRDLLPRSLRVRVPNAFVGDSSRRTRGLREDVLQFRREECPKIDPLSVLVFRYTTRMLTSDTNSPTSWKPVALWRRLG